jgi:pyrimidine-nucleoside phosphorylase/thymidine phosphorylase
LTPADKKIYALRDVTATVDSIPLIASSIMSKKIASGADCIVLDVKTGSGAFMKTVPEAVQLARTMVDIGISLGRKTIALVTDMSQPLGHEVGNANEVDEAIKILNGKGAEDETTIALTIASHMTVLGGKFTNFNAAFAALKSMIKSGKALEKFKEFLSLQGGDPKVVDNPDLLPHAANHIEIRALHGGYINAIDAEKVGISAMLLGAGRKTKEDRIDHGAGITVYAKVGTKVAVNDVLCVLHTNRSSWKEAEVLAAEAFSTGREKPEPKPYVYEVIG